MLKIELKWNGGLTIKSDPQLGGSAIKSSSSNLCNKLLCGNCNQPNFA